MIVHARGLGQVNPLCKGGHIGTLGPARPWDEVTCLQCQIQPFAQAARTIVDGLAAIGKAIAEAYTQFARALRDE